MKNPQNLTAPSWWRHRTYGHFEIFIFLSFYSISGLLSSYKFPNHLEYYFLHQKGQKSVQKIENSRIFGQNAIFIATWRSKQIFKGAESVKLSSQLCKNYKTVKTSVLALIFITWEAPQYAFKRQNHKKNSIKVEQYLESYLPQFWPVLADFFSKVRYRGTTASAKRNFSKFSILVVFCPKNWNLAFFTVSDGKTAQKLKEEDFCPNFSCFHFRMKCFSNPLNFISLNFFKVVLWLFKVE